MADYNEYKFEIELCEALETAGWLYSKSDSGYDRELALFPADVHAWLEETQPNQYAKLVKDSDPQATRERAKSALVQRLAKSLDAPLESGGGTLNVLRKGFKDGPARFSMCQFMPADQLNAATWETYGKVRLRVMRQVHYSLKNEKCIDLVFFVNGIPVATVELKTDFTQSVEDAKVQYRKDREPKGEPLLTFGKRALVHFAMSNDEVYMTTKLDGDKTIFLPFNKGNDGRAGNPLNPSGSRTAYMWEDLWQRDNFLQIIGRFMHLSVERRADPVTGEVTTRETLLFPRYHQWDSVCRLVSAARTEGPGHKYLIQHSAGSGKTNSIAWTAHQLSSLHAEDGKKVFDSVIVVTDRTVLDDQLSAAVLQIESKTGVVAAIDNKNGAKSAALAEALQQNKPIITVTMQTFPFILNQIQETAAAHGKSFAIIADEAHSSQAGNTASALKQVLSPEEWHDLEDGGESSIEDYLLASMENKAEPKNISFFAYTATPKAKTLEMFGRPNADGLPAPFHLYTMQQAIEEDFILDVLQNYTPYKLAFQLTHNGQEYDSDSVEVVQNDALKQMMNWVRLHPTNIGAKVSNIVEHFRDNISWRLDGKAKAMVVTSSRKEAVRYKLAFDKYISQKGYTDIKALVAFSGEVEDPESGPDKFTEANMNTGLKGQSLPEAFKTDEFQVMLAANKFQTGFDQPLLVAMYVDKKLSGVTAVQTLSRLNRIASGKDATFILDFVNQPDDILKAFQPYFKDAQLIGITDPNLVHDISAKLQAYGIFNMSEVEVVATAFLLKKGNNQLAAALGPVVDRYAKKLEGAEESNDKTELDSLYEFRRSLDAYAKTYEFLSQLYNYADTELEKLSIFTKLLSRLIKDHTKQSIIDLNGLELLKLGFKKSSAVKIELDGEDAGLKPLTAAGTGVPHEPAMTTLKEAIEQMNTLFDAEALTSGDFEGFITYVAEKAKEEKDIQQQAQANTLEQFLESPDLKPLIMAALFASQGNFTIMTNEIVQDPVKFERIVEIIGKVIHNQLAA